MYDTNIPLEKDPPGENIRKRQLIEEDRKKETHGSSLRLFGAFVPRQLTIHEKISNFKRNITFGDSGELNLQLVQSVEDITLLREERISGDSKFDDDTSNHSPSRTTISTDVTPNSITDELTNVPEPYQVQKKFLAVNKKADTENDAPPLPNNSNASQTTTSVTKRPLENGLSKVNGVHAAVNGYKKSHMVDSPQTSNQQLRPNRNSESRANEPSTSASFTNGIPSRKRVLSERGEQEKQYPRIEKMLLNYNSWNGCTYVSGKNCGVGLYNPLNNCFLNSVLQAIVHIPHLSRTILESRDARMCTINSNEQCFHCVLKKHIHRAITSQYPFNPGLIQQHLRRIFPHHRHGVQEDAHEMLTLLLGALEPHPPKSVINGIKSGLSIPSTPIEQIFGGNLRNELICNICKHPHTNYERIREMNLGLTRNYRVQLQILLDDFFKDEQVQNFQCSRCQKKLTATRKTCLLTSPMVLIIQLKRFNAFGGKNRTSVQPDSHIDLSKYSFKNEPLKYRLHGLIEHIGTGLNFGHYVCAMRGFDNQWYLFDDSQRSQTTINRVVQQMEPYILIYTALPTSQQNVQRRFSLDGYQPPVAKQQHLMYQEKNYIHLLNNSFS